MDTRRRLPAKVHREIQIAADVARRLPSPDGTGGKEVFQNVYVEAPKAKTWVDYAWHAVLLGMALIAFSGWLHLNNMTKIELAKYSLEEKKIDLAIAEVRGPEGWSMGEVGMLALVAIGIALAGGGGATVIVRRAAGR